MEKKKLTKRQETERVVIEKGIYCAICAKTVDLVDGLCPICGRPI